MSAALSLRLAGATAGFASGLFGGGGGLVLVPPLSHSAGLLPERLYPTCMAVMFPVCLFSAGIYCFQDSLSLSLAAPYLLGGFLGGITGGRLYARVPVLWLNYLFAAVLFYSGVRYLL